ncbi:MAG: ATP-binding protein [Gemmatimonadota bacterium]
MQRSPDPPAVPTGAARLADWIERSEAQIVRGWTETVRADARIQSDRSLSYAEFIDHIPKVLEELCSRLRGVPPQEEDARIRRDATQHGVFRWRQGYDLAEVLRETAHLRQVLLDTVSRSWQSAGILPQETHELWKTAARILDEGQVATVLTYVAERDREVADREADVVQRDQVIAERDRRLQQDLLERERARVEVLEAAARAKDEFLATLSHELRTPLTPILAWVAILERSSSSPSVAGAVRTVGRNARVLAQLIDELLDVSRIVVGKLDVAREPVDLRTVARAARDTVLPQAAAREVRLAMDEPPQPLVVSGDATRLQQVVWNLLSNGVKFSRSGGEVRLEVRESDGDARITVSDDGEGIDPAFLPRVFDRFSQQDQAVTRGHGGLGLGLAIARAITEAHEGRLTAASDGPGKGSRFELRLPLAEAHPSGD